MASYLVAIQLIYTLSTTWSLQINGPKSVHDKIAIVGAGPAGIHMAYMLQQKGFKNLQILEKTSRIGGKSYTLSYRGVAHDMGTVYLAPDYEDNIIKLVKKFLSSDELIPFPPASVWLDYQPTEPITYQQYVGSYLMKLLKTSNKTILAARVQEAVLKYVKLHNEIFGIYEGDLMPEPSSENLKKIKGTFMQFLVRNDLTVLVPLFLAAYTVQGYGHMDEIATLYGLMWNTPKLTLALLRRFTRQSKKEVIYILKSGFQKLWETIVAKERLRVSFNVEIYRVYRAYDNGCQDVWIYKQHGNSPPSWEHYDFLIWSPEMKKSMDRWRNKIGDERELFTRTQVKFFTTSLVNTKNGIRGLTPIDYWLDNIVKKRENSVWAQRDSYATIHEYRGLLYKNSSLRSGDDGQSTKTSVIYQMGTTKPSEAFLKGVIEQQLKRIMATDINIREIKIWRYFPRYSPTDVANGTLWRILEMQGKYAMWYIGSSVCFESVKSVVEYNKLIVKNMIEPTDSVKNLIATS